MYAAAALTRAALLPHRGRRAAHCSVAALLSLWSWLALGCAAVAPRLPAPLPDRAVAVGAFAGGGGGGLGSSVTLLPYGVGFAGATAAWQAARAGSFALELDGGLGAGIPSLPGATPFLGAQGGARGWYLPRGAALGVDVCASAMAGTMESQSAFQGGGPTTLSQVVVELRGLAALQVAEGLWLGTRPGALLVWSSALSGATLVPELPLGVAWDLLPVRLGLEGAWQIPYGGRGGASVALSF